MAARSLLLLVLLLISMGVGVLWVLREPLGMDVGQGGGAGAGAETAGGETLLSDPGLVTPGGSSAGTRDDLIAVEGRVIQAANGKGLAGFRARLWTGLGIAAEVVTDAEGRFGFPAADEPEAWVQVVPLEGWALKKDTLDVKGERLVFRALPEPRDALAFQFIDAETAEPVPHYTLEVWEGESTHAFEELLSDAAGRATTTTHFAESRLLYRELDHLEMTATRRRHIHSLAHAPGGDGFRPLTLHVGPTYELDLELPEGMRVAQFEAVLVPAHRRYDGSRINGWPTPLRMTRNAEGDLRLWVRFLPYSMMWPFDDPERSGPFYLELHESVGRWFGSVRVDTVVGIQPGKVAIQLQELAQVRGRVVDADGKPERDVSVRLDPAHDAAVRWSFDEQTTGANGVFQFKGLFPGAWLLRAQTSDRGLGEVALNLTSGERREVDVALVRVPTAPIRGRIESATGTYADDAWIWLEPVDPELLSLSITREAKWNEEDAPTREATFDFGELPVGEYRLSIDSFSDFPFVPAKLVVTNPAEDIVFRLMDDQPLTALAFTPESAPEGSLYLRWTQDGVGHEESLVEEFITFPVVRPGAPLDWALFSKGYRPVQGDESDLRPIEEAPWNGAHVASVAFQPGWGRIVSVEDSQGEPLSGTTVLLDDLAVGTTGPEGCLVVSADAAPRAVSARRSGWKVTDSYESHWHVRLTLGAR